MQKTNFVLGVDIGGTHISAAIVDTAKWKIKNDNVVRNHVFSQGDAKTILHDWAETISTAIKENESPIQQVGIALPGPFDYEKGISFIQGQSKYDELYGWNVIDDLALKLHLEPHQIKLINDAASFLQGEVHAQGLEQEDKILGITLGTGLGSASWEKGEKALDANLWNTPYLASIYEEYLTTRWFTGRFHELSGIEVSGLREIITHHEDEEAFQIIRKEFCDHLASFLDYFSEKYQCNHFILGGNISKAFPKLSKGQEDKFEKYQIKLAILGEKAAIIGAASLFN